jgi:hypothetical protein
MIVGVDEKAGTTQKIRHSMPYTGIKQLYMRKIADMPVMITTFGVSYHKI